jgi:hypothetical protein
MTARGTTGPDCPAKAHVLNSYHSASASDQAFLRGAYSKPDYDTTEESSRGHVSLHIILAYSPSDCNLSPAYYLVPFRL